VVELREKVGPEAPAALGRAGPADGDDDPRRLARDGLLELGYAPAEAESLLRGAAGETPEELLQDALRAARRAA
jgi:Holliday junction DNA helicase RuvA